MYKLRSTALSQALFGDYAAAVASAREGLELQREKPAELMVAPEFHAVLAEGLCGLGEHEEALAEAEQAVTEAAGKGRILTEAIARRAHALALAHVKGEAGRADIEETLRIAEERLDTCSSPHWKAHLHERRARVAQILGDPHEAHLRAAEEAFEKLGLTAQSDRITQELAT